MSTWVSRVITRSWIVRARAVRAWSATWAWIGTVTRVAKVTRAIGRRTGIQGLRDQWKGETGYGGWYGDPDPAANSGWAWGWARGGGGGGGWGAGGGTE